MKLLKHLMMLALVIFIAASCSDDEDEPDVTAPTGELTAPEAGEGFAFGGDLLVTGTVTDDQGLSSITITVTASGATSPAITETITEFDSNTSHALNSTITLPDEVGNYTLSVVAADNSGNEGDEGVAIVVGVQLQVTVPTNTPEAGPVHVVGNFNEWDPGMADYQLTKQENGTYLITVTTFVTNETEFKFTRGSWDKVEKDEACAEIDNRKYEGASSMQLTIAKWRDLDQCD